MGQKLSTSVEDYTSPEIAPRFDRPATFDPVAGFPHGRKPREMKATWEEMDQYGLTIGQRDYCAHLLIPLIKCQTNYTPVAGHMCHEERHAWDKCEYDDYIMRMKEYEREKRLLLRKKRKEAAGQMKSAIGAISAPADVLAQRYTEFYEELAADSTGPSFVYLAAFIDRLTPQMFQSLQSQIQRKLVEASKIEHHMGVTFFAWNLLKKQPKMFSYNQETFKTIAFSSLDFTFRKIYVEADTGFSAEPAFNLFSAHFNSSMNLLINTIEELKKRPPYKKQSILQLPIIQQFGRKLNSELMSFFLDLLGCMIRHSDRGQRIQLDILLKMVATCLQNPDKVVHARALNVLVQVAVVSQGYFARASNAAFEMINNFDIVPNVLYKFLLELNHAVGSQIDIVRFFPNVLTNFVDGLKMPGSNNNANELLLIGRTNAEEMAKKIVSTCQKESSDFQLHAELIVALIENNPASLPIEPLLKIQKYVCNRVLTFTPEVIDLKLLNALLSVSNEKMPSPCQVARTIYSWKSIHSNKELTPFVIVGRALCEAQRSSRFLSYTSQTPEYNHFLVSELTNTAEQEDKPMEVEEQPQINLKPTAVEIEEQPQVNSSIEPQSAPVIVPEEQTIQKGNSSDNLSSSSSTVNVVENAPPESDAPVVEEVSDDDCVIIEEKPSSPKYVKTIDMGSSLPLIGSSQSVKREVDPSPMKSSSVTSTPVPRKKRKEDNDIQVINPLEKNKPRSPPIEYNHPTSKSVMDMLKDFHDD